MEFKEIEFRGMTLTEEDLIQLFYYKFTETPLLKRMDAVKDYFIDFLGNSERQKYFRG